MICPLCYGHKLLQAEGRWYCPQCYHVYPYSPVYGPKLYQQKAPPGAFYNM